MSASPFRPSILSESTVAARVLSPSEQAAVDRLYWDESEWPLKVSDIAERFDLPSGNRVHHFVTPWPSERTCLLCGAAAVCTSRSQRSSGALTCGECGATVQSHATRYGYWSSEGEPPHLSDEVMASEVDPVPVPHVMVRRRLGDRLRDLGNDASTAVSALQRSGRPFVEGRTVLILEPHDGIEAIQELLAAHPVSTVAVASLRTLGDSQVEAMQNLLYLTNDGWRVVSAVDSNAWERREDQEWFHDEFDWPVPDSGEAEWDHYGICTGGRIIDASHRFRSGW